MEKQRKKLTIFLITLLCVSVCCLMLTACDFTYRFTINGKVTVNGVPVEGVKVSCDVAETTTDADGKYELTEITGEVKIKFSSDEYWFPEVTGKYWTDTTVDMTAGKKLRTVSGKCVNGGMPVVNAAVTLEGVNKTLVTFTDELGQFAAPGLAGDVKVSAVADGQKLFGQTCPDGDTKPIVLQASAEIKLRFTAEQNLSDGEFSLVYGSRTITVKSTDGEVVADNVSFDTELQLVSDKYGFDKQTFAVTQAGEIVDIRVYDKYNLSGTIVCGTTALADADIVVDGQILAKTNADGKFAVDGLFGKHTLWVNKQGYVSQSADIDKSANKVNADLFKKISGVVRDDFGKPVADVTLSVSDRTAQTDKYGKFALLVRDGETVTATARGYVFDKISVTSQTLDLTTAGKTLYDVDLTFVGDDDGLFVSVADDKIIVSDIEGGEAVTNGVVTLAELYGAKQIEFVADGYRVSGATKVDAKQTKATLNVKKLYALSNVLAASGQVVVGGAKVYVNGELATESGTDGLFDITLADGDQVQVVAEGYDKFTTNYRSDGGLAINLTYTLNFEVTANDKLHFDLSVNGVIRSVTGGCALTGLSDRTTVQAVREYHTFDIDNTGSDECEYTSGGSHTLSYVYAAQVSVSREKAPAAGVTVVLIDNLSDVDPVEKITDSDGKVTFDGLTSVYTVICNDLDGVRFKPEYITVSEGGLYVFADVGYSVNVKVLVGDKPLSDVVLAYDGRTSRTSANGECKLNLFDDTTVTLSKDGYEFDNSQLTLTADDDETTIVVNATYKVCGKVYSGNFPVAGATVAIDKFTATSDQYGNFQIEGVNVTDVSVTVTKNGFVAYERTIDGYVELDVQLYVDIDFDFVSGNLPVDGVVAKVDGVATDKFVLGNLVTFEKDGYAFDSVAVSLLDIGKTVVVNATYTVNGKVTNGGEPLGGTEVVVDDKTVAVAAIDGTFIVSGLVGETELEFVSDGYDIAAVTVTGPCQVNAVATYDVVVRVNCGDEPLGGVAIKIRGKTIAVTDSQGVATLTDLGGDNTLALSLDGYTFEGDNKVYGACEVVFTATYAVSGSVKIGGETPVGRVEVTLDGKVVAQTDASGNFTVSGLSGQTTLSFVKDGYAIDDLTVSAPAKAAVAAKFFVQAEFDGDIGGAKAFVNGDETAITDSTMRFGPFDGETVIVFAKDGYTFSPSQIRATDYIVRAISVGRAFSVSGRVTTSGGLPVVGMTMSAGEQKTVTDTNGNYSFAGLAGNVQVSGKFEFAVNGKNLFEHDCATGGSKVLSTDSSNIDFTIADAQYAWALYEANYLVRLGKYGNTPYKISGGADVTATFGVKTAGGFVKIKDAKGNIITESSNYGKSVAGVDPSVGLVNFAYAGSDKVTYAQVNGGSKVPAADKANYSSATFTDTTDSGYADIYGASPQGILIYKIADSTVSSASVAKEGSGYKLSLELKTTDEMFAAYKKQVKTMSDMDLASFQYVRLYFTLDAKGWVTVVRIEEQYKVQMMGAQSTAVMNHTYTYTNIPDLSSFKADNATVQKLLGR